MITEARPFHCFVVRQISYESQFKQYELDLDDIKMLTVVGKGAFGTVFLGKIITTQKYYAIKMLKKNEIISKDSIDQVKMEISINQSQSHPNLLGIDNVLQQQNFIFLVLPFAEGGDLQKFGEKMDQEKNDFQEDHILYMVIQMILGLDHLHKNNIVHRDIKEMNMLLDQYTNIQICDFGLAHRFESKEETLKDCCGTPGYWAPEQVNHQPHRMMPDWFALGVVIYKLMMKKGPFDPVDMDYQGVKEGPQRDEAREKYRVERNRRMFNCAPHPFTDNYSKNLQDLVLQLLNIDQTQRLGSSYDADEVLSHPVFTKQKIERAARNGNYNAPNKPKLQDNNQDYNSHENKNKIARALNCFDPNDEKLILQNQGLFQDKIFGGFAN